MKNTKRVFIVGIMLVGLSLSANAHDQAPLIDEGKEPPPTEAKTPPPDAPASDTTVWDAVKYFLAGLHMPF